MMGHTYDQAEAMIKAVNRLASATEDTVVILDGIRLVLFEIFEAMPGGDEDSEEED